MKKDQIGTSTSDDQKSANARLGLLNRILRPCFGSHARTAEVVKQVEVHRLGVIPFHSRLL